MKIFITLTLLCLAFPAFSQSGNAQRFNALSESMGTAISRSNSNLQDFDSQMKDDSDVRTFMSYRKKFEYLSKTLQESEGRMNLYFRTNDRLETKKAERDNYEALIHQLETVKSEYDSFVRTAQ